MVGEWHNVAADERLRELYERDVDDYGRYRLTADH